MTIYTLDAHSSYNIDDNQQCNELMEKLDQEPEKMIEFYKFICDINNKLYEVKPDLVNTVVDRIKTLDDSGKLDDNQIKKIMHINAFIHPNLGDLKIKDNVSSYFQTKLNEQNVFEGLKLAKKNNNEVFVQQCLKFIKEKYMVELIEMKDSLNVLVLKPIHLNQVSKIVEELPEEDKQKNIKIQLNLKDEYNLSDFRRLLEDKGSCITRVALKQIDSESLNSIIKQCPNLEILDIDSNDNVTRESLEGLQNLNRLTVLQVWNCKNLQNLPPLPKSLEILFLRGCPQIHTLPSLPSHLNSLKLQMCKNIDNISQLPDSLHIFELSICPNMKCYPALPGELSDVTLQVLPNTKEEFLRNCLAKTLDEKLDQGLALCKTCKFIDKIDIEKVLASKLDSAIANKQKSTVEKILKSVLDIQSESDEGWLEVSIVDQAIHLDICDLHIKPEEVAKIRKYLSEIYTDKEIAIKISKETVDQFDVKIREFVNKVIGLNEISDWGNVSQENIKAQLLSFINEWDNIINLGYEYKDWDTVKTLQVSCQNILSRFGDKIKGVISTLFKENADELIDKLHSIYAKLEDTYLDVHRLLKGSYEDKPISPAHFQWYLSQAILQEKAKNLDPTQRKLLYLLILQAYRKAAGFAEAESLNAQATPLFPQQKGYYRHDEWEVTKKCTGAFAKKMGVTEKMYLVNNPLFKEVMLRELPDPGLGTDIASIADFNDFLNNLQSYMTHYSQHNTPFLVDISKWMEKEKVAPANMHTVVVTLQEAYRKKFGSNMDWVSKIQLMAFNKHEGQDILLLPQFFNQAHTQALTSIEAVLNHSGYRPSPSQIIEAWIKVEDPQKILSQENIPLATLATSKEHGIPTVCKNCGELAQTVIIKQFEDLSTIENAPPYLKVLSKSTANMLKGLVNCHIDESFKEKGLEDLLQISYFRILNAMHEAICVQGNYIEFANQIGIIHGEIQSILTVAAPYKEKDLEQAIVDNLTKEASILPADLERPKVHLFASGMHSLASVLAALEAEKGHKAINTLVLYDTYFESTQMVRGAKDYNINVINPNEKGQGSIQYVSGSYARARQPNDLYLCEFHHNICFGRSFYSPENVLGQVKFLRGEGTLAKPCTVVIDTTINLEHADNVRQFLADDEIKQAIKDGELNVVLLRSAQKFDMLGQDNYYGGITTTINNGEKFARFNERMNNPQDQLKDSNYQGLTHLQKYGDLDAYRKAIHENTEKLYKSLPFSSGGHIMVSKMEKENLYFLDIKFEGSSLASAFKERLLNFANERKLPLTTRSSFGFANTNLSIIDKNIFRLNPGLDDEKILQQYAEFFKAVQDVIDQVKSSPDAKNKRADELDRIIAQEIYSMNIHVSA